MSPLSNYVILYSGIILLAINGLFAKGIPLDAVTITQLRSTVAAVFIASALLLLKRSLRIANTKKLIGVLLLGVVMGFHWMTFFHSMQISTIAIGMLSLFTFPVIVVFLEAAIHKRLPYWQDIVSAGLVLMGAALIANPFSDTNYSESTIIFGVLWGLLSALLFASRNVVQKYYFHDVSSDKLMLYQVIAIAVMALPFLSLDTLNTIATKDWLKILALGIVTTATAHTLLVISYKNLPAKTVAMISCLQPVIGAGLAWIFFREQLTLMVAAGGLIILLVATYESIKKTDFKR